MTGMAQSHPVTDRVIEASNEAFTGFEPEGGLEWADFHHAMPGVFSELGDHIRAMGERLGDDYPDDPAVTDGWHDAANQVAALHDHFEELAQLFERQHAEELARLRDPRPNEEVWDVTRNQ
jgi:hypothetical protein